MPIYNPPTGGAGGVAASLSGNTAGVMALVSSGTMYLAGGNNVTLSQNANSITISGGAAGGADGVNAFVVNGGASTNSTTLALSNSNNISFGLNAGTITASASYPAQTVQPVAISGSNGSFLFSTATMGNLNGMSFYTSNGSMVGSYTVPTVPTQTSFQLSNSNGVSFGTNGSTVTATVRTDYQSAGAYLTTAMASNRGSDFVQANAVFNGTNATGTIASNGISVSVANPSAGVGIAAGTRSATTAGNLLFDNANGVTFGLNAVGGSIMTASHNGLTTARASTDAIGLNTAQTNVTWTANSNGLSLNASGYAGTATATTGSISVTLNSGGLSLNAPSFLTTAAQSSASNISGVIAATASNGATNQTAQLSGAVSFANGSGVSFFTTVSGATSGIAASVATNYQSSNANYLTSQSNQAVSNSAGSFTFQTLNFSNANNVTFGTSAGGIVTASVATNYQSQGAYLTTARASNDAVGLNTAATNVTWTVNSSGISLNNSAYLTTAMASNRGSDFVQANAGFAGTNASGTIASNGISVSVAAGGASNTPVASASNGSFTFSTIAFSNANNVTFGTSAGGIMTASVAAPGAGAENNAINLLGANTAGNTTATGSTIGWSGINLTLSGTNGSAVNISAPATSSFLPTGQLTISTTGSTISIGVPSAVTVSRYNEFKESPMVAGNIGQGSLHIQPWIIPNLHMDRVVLHKIYSNASNSSGSFSVSDYVGIYTRNVSTLSLLHSVSGSHAFTGSGTVGSYLSYGGGLKAVTMGLSQTLTEGMYWIGVINRTTTGGAAGHTLNQALNSQVNTSFYGTMGVSTNVTNQMTLGFGAWSTTTSAMPDAVAFADIRGNSSVFLRPPSVYFMSSLI